MQAPLVQFFFIGSSRITVIEINLIGQLIDLNENYFPRLRVL